MVLYYGPSTDDLKLQNFILIMNHFGLNKRKHLADCSQNNIMEPSCINQMQKEISKLEFTMIVVVVNFADTIINATPKMIISALTRLSTTIARNCVNGKHGLTLVGNKQKVLEFLRTELVRNQCSQETSMNFFQHVHYGNIKEILG